MRILADPDPDPQHFCKILGGEVILKDRRKKIERREKIFISNVRENE